MHIYAKQISHYLFVAHYKEVTIIFSSAKTLQISYIGMETQEVTIKPRLKVVLKSDAKQIDEVIVVAYGTAKKAAFTGSASTMKAEKIAMRQVSNVTNALVGSVAGVQGTSANGQPGEDAKIKIRGIGSMSSSNDPLYVVDGVPYDGSISAINSQDIESISVLKDASASAIYGARGANGVVLITTKKGVSGGNAVVTVDAKWGSNSRAVPNYNVMKDPAMYYETFYKAMYNSQAYNGKSASEARAYALKNMLDVKNGGLGYQVYNVPVGEDFIGTDGKVNKNAKLGYSDGNYYYTPDNWYDEMFDKGNLRQEYNASISGSSDKLNFYMSLGYLDDSGIVEGSGFTRYTGRLKADYQAKPWLKVGANMGYTYYNSKAPTNQTDWGSTGNLFYITSMIAPIYPMYVRNADGNVKVDNNGMTVYDSGNSTGQVRAFMAMSNPGVSLKLDRYESLTNVINAKFYAIVDLYKGLQFNANVGVNTSDQRSSILYNPFYGGSVSAGGQVEVEHYRKIGLNQQFLFTYKTSFAQKHGIDILAGYESYNLKLQDLDVQSKKLYNPWVGEISNAIFETPKATSYTDRYSTKGWLFRAQYDYDEKYFFSASYRRDASSRFHPDNRWGNFGSVGAAWLINKEEFFNVDWVNMLKLKASYGVQGNDNLNYSDGTTNYYPYLDQYTLGSSNGDFAPTFTYKGNKDITWETSHSVDLGVEFGLFHNRLTGSIDYFNRKTTDLLYNQPVSLTQGYSYMPKNVGSMRNSGVEFDLTGVLLNTDKVYWSLSLNGTHYKNKILTLDSSVAENGITRTVTIWKVGGSLFNSYLREYAGVDKETGKALYYVDPDKGDMSTTDDWSAAKQADLGSSLPKIYGGISTTVSLYGFDISMALSYQLGGKFYDFSYQELMHSGDGPGKNWHKDILNAWTPENTNTDVPRISTADKSNQLLSSRFLVNSNYLSLNNITVGFTIPQRLSQKFNINKLRFYVVGDNLGLLTARKGVDPRQSLGTEYFQSTGAGMYTSLRTISGGVTITF